MNHDDLMALLEERVRWAMRDEIESINEQFGGEMIDAHEYMPIITAGTDFSALRPRVA